MSEFLINIGFQPLVADFIAKPEWIHMLSAALLVILCIGVAYLLRIDLDPLIFGVRQPFRATIERLIFYPALIAVLIWTYYFRWEWPTEPVQGFYWNKFTIGGALMLAMILGRAIIHFINTEKNRWDFFDQLPFYLMIEFQFAVPLVYYYALERNGLMPKEELGFALACLFLGYYAIRILLGRPIHLPRDPVSPWLLLFIAYVLLTVIVFPYRLAAVKNVIQWVAFASCFLVGFASIPDRRRRDAVLMAAIVAALVSTLWGFWKYFDVPLNVFGIKQGVYPQDHDLAGQAFFYKTPSAGRYFLLAGFFANPNYYGEYLSMVIYLTLGLIFSTDSRKLRTFLAISLAISMFEMVALYNRAGWLGMFTGMGFVLIGLAWARLPVFKRISKTGLIGGVAGLVIVLFLTGLIFNRRETDDTPLRFTPLERLKSMTDFKGDETFRNRLTMWRAAFLMMKDPAEFPQRLIFGGGFGFFEVNYLPYQTEVLETYDFNTWFHNVIPTFRAHNDHLQMLVEAGLIGTSLYVLVFVTFFMFGFRFLREEEDPARRLFALGVLGAVASLVAIAFFSFPLHEIEHGGLLFTAMGMMVAEICRRNRKRVETTIELEKTALPEPESRGGKKKTRKAAPVQAANIETWPKEFFITIWKRVPLILSAPLIAIALFLTTWGVYTQIINFKSQYFVVKGIATLRGLDGSLPENARLAYAQMAANFFFGAYRLDPTNGRAEFFNGFALSKKGTYEDTVAGVQALEEGQLLYPQSDTFYALAMGYESRQRLAQGKAQDLQTQIQALKDQNPVPPGGTMPPDVQSRLDDLDRERTRYIDDAQMSMNRAIDAYMTAAKYYPVKVEYYKELLRLLEAQGRWEEVIPWAERALVVDNWLLKKPPIRWQLYLWLGKAHRAIGAQQIRSGDLQAGLESWSKAEAALLEAKKLSNAVYYSYYELGQIHEALGELAQRDGDTAKAMEQYSKARDMYVDVFKWKGNVQSGSSPFDYAYLLLARIYEKLGDTDRALTYYRGLMNESLYSNNTETYQKAREKVHELTGNWEGQPPTGQVQQEAGKDEPSDWIGTQQ